MVKTVIATVVSTKGIIAILSFKEFLGNAYEYTESAGFIELSRNHAPLYRCGNTGVYGAGDRDSWHFAFDLGSFEQNLVGICFCLYPFSDDHCQNFAQLLSELKQAATETDKQSVLATHFGCTDWMSLVDTTSGGTADGRINLYSHSTEGESLEIMSYVLGNKRLMLGLHRPNQRGRNFYNLLAHAIYEVPVFLSFLEKHLPEADADLKLKLIGIGLTGLCRSVETIG